MFTDSSILLLVAIIIILGGAAGEVAKRFHLPSLVGQLLLGIVLGESVLHLVPHTAQIALQPLVTFALSLIAVSIGGHLEFRRLHNAKRRILIISITQTVITFWLVFFCFQKLNPLNLSALYAMPIHLLIASIATSTSPVSTLHVIKEKRAKGLLVKTTIAIIAINNLITLLIFAICRAISVDILSSDHTLLGSLVPAGCGVLFSLAIGAGVGFLLTYYYGHLGRKHEQQTMIARHRRILLHGGLFSGLLVAMFLASGLCEFISYHFEEAQLNLSPILANMMVGLVLANRSSFKEEVLSLFDVLEQTVFTLFFVLAGAHVVPGALKLAWAGALLFFLLRMSGKWGGGTLGGLLSRTTPKMALNIGPMLTAQGAIAIALVIIIQQDALFKEVSAAITASVLSAVVLAELVSAVLISKTLDRTQEARRDRIRLIEFLQEEFIQPRLYARNQQEALRELSYFLVHTHDLEISDETVFEAVWEREKSMPTAIGKGVAVPHAKLKEGLDGIVGVVGLLDPPLDFNAPDGIPVRLVILIATPEQEAHRHLQVIAAITRMVQNPKIRDAIFEAKSAAEIHEVIDSEEAETFNYFVET